MIDGRLHAREPREDVDEVGLRLVADALGDRLDGIVAIAIVVGEPLHGLLDAVVVEEGAEVLAIALVSEAINEGYGKNFRSFLNDYRIKEAMQRLADNDRYGNYTIKAISESVGYKSQANFINIFTRLTGMKPSIYQKISRERISIEKSC